MFLLSYAARGPRRSPVALIVFSIALQFAVPIAVAQVYLPDGFSLSAPLASGFSNATCMCMASDGTIYVAMKSGEIRLWREGAGLLPAQFFAGQSLAVETSGERGLIGMALDPDFDKNRYLYVHYTANSTPRHGRISRFTADADGKLALPGSEAILLELNNLTSVFHNGGGIRFGPDGMLYVGVGENGTSSNSQSIGNLFGKMLRIRPTPGDVIPNDNPTGFPGIAGTPTGNNRAIWAVGLRNPFSFEFDPGTGRLFINDVGGVLQEEINEGGAGRNYGWPATEGHFLQSAFPNYQQPFHAYAHDPDAGQGACICGGAFYVPAIRPYPNAYAGTYFFGDYVAGTITRIDPLTGEANIFAQNMGSGVIDLKLDAGGRLLVLSPTDLRRIDYLPLPPVCALTESAILTPSDSNSTMSFGVGMAVSGDRLFCGAFNDLNGRGSVYAFIRDGNAWDQQAKLIAPDGQVNDWFGGAVAVDGDWALIGASGCSLQGSPGAGAVYVFHRTGTTWVPQGIIEAPDAQAYDAFGVCVTMSSDVALIGAPSHGASGKVYEYTRLDQSWVLTSELTSPGQPPQARFGGAIAMQGRTAAIGATGELNAAGVTAGAVHAFVRENNGWVDQGKLSPGESSGDARFGSAVSLSGDSLLIGAPGTTVAGNWGVGAAYLYSRTGSNWTQVDQWVPPATTGPGYFGASVAIGENRAIVGAPFAYPDRAGQGAVCIYSRNHSGWKLKQRATSASPHQLDRLGYLVALLDDDSMLASRSDGTAATVAGSVLTFDLSSMRNGDLNGDRVIDGLDLNLFLDVLLDRDADLNHAEQSDMNCSGSADGRDIADFVEAVLAP